MTSLAEIIFSSYRMTLFSFTNLIAVNRSEISTIQISYYQTFSFVLIFRQKPSDVKNVLVVFRAFLYLEMSNSLVGRC